MCALLYDTPLLHKIVYVSDGFDRELGFTIVRHQPVDLLLDISELRVADADDGGVFRDRLVEASQAVQRSSLCFFNSGIAPGFGGDLVSLRDVGDASEL